MGKWTAFSHRIWEWTTNTEEKELFRQFDDKCVKYVKSQGRARGLWVKEGESVSYSEDKNVSVKNCMEDGCKIRSVGSKFHLPAVTEETFWDVLDKWGGSWMWKDVREKYEGQDMDWLMEGMKNNSLV